MCDGVTSARGRLLDALRKTDRDPPGVKTASSAEQYSTLGRLGFVCHSVASCYYQVDNNAASSVPALGHIPLSAVLPAF